MIKSFDESGLSPWNPPLIMKNAMTYSPVRASPNKDDIMNDLMKAVTVEKHEKVDKCWEILSRLERVTPLTPEKGGGKGMSRKDKGKGDQKEKKEESPSGPRKKRRISSNPPQKQKLCVRQTCKRATAKGHH